MLASSVSQAMIFGEDNRKPLSMEYAAKAGFKPVVYMLLKKSAGLMPCSGAWISETHILTARHCVANASSVLVINQYANYLGDSRALGARFYVDESSSNNQNDWYNRRGKYNDARPNSKDWAVIEIIKEVGGEPATFINEAGREVKNLQVYGDGATNGRFPVIDSRVLLSAPGVVMAAYHTDANDTLYREFCRYRPRSIEASFWLMNSPGLIEFDCDTAVGASGAPILKCDGSGKCGIVAIFSGGNSNEENHLPEYDARYGGMAVPSKNFMTTVNRIIRGDASNAKTFRFTKPACKLTSCLTKLF